MTKRLDDGTAEVFGLPVIMGTTAGDFWNTIPQGIVMVVKVMGPDGREHYVPAASESLNMVEAIGALRFALMIMERALMDTDDPEE